MSPTWARLVSEFARDQQAEYTYFTAHHTPGGPAVSKKKHGKHDDAHKADKPSTTEAEDAAKTKAADTADLETLDADFDVPSPLSQLDKEKTAGAQPPAGAGGDAPESAADQPPKGLAEGAAESRMPSQATSSLVVTSNTLVDLRLRTLATKLASGLSDALGTVVRLYLAVDSGDLPELTAEHLITWASHGGYSDLRVQALWAALKTSGYLKKGKKGHFELTPFDQVILPADVPATDPTKSPDSPADK